MTPGVYGVHLIVDGSACDHAWGQIRITPIATGSGEHPRASAAGPLPGGAWIPPCLRVAGQKPFDEEK